MKTCSVPDCEKKHCAKGFCKSHYQKLIQRKKAQTEKTCGNSYVYIISNLIEGDGYYIGFTQMQPETRWNRHKLSAQTSIASHYPLYQKMKQYEGIPGAFKFEVVAELWDSEAALKLEGALIWHYRQIGRTVYNSLSYDQRGEKRIKKYQSTPPFCYCCGKDMYNRKAGYCKDCRIAQDWKSRGYHDFSDEYEDDLELKCSYYETQD